MVLSARLADGGQIMFVVLTLDFLCFLWFAYALRIVEREVGLVAENCECVPRQ